MASVALDFIPPTDPDIVALRIYEAPLATDPFVQIERVAAIGAYPNYISRYVTDLATTQTDWFAIAWENEAGIVSSLSSPIQGGTTSLVGILVARMLLRDPSLNENIADQEAEAAISDFYNVLDPFTIDPATVSPKIMSGLTNLALARTYMTRAITATASKNKWAAGIVSMDSSSGSAGLADNVKRLLDLANRELGRSYSVVMLLKEMPVAGGFRKVTGVDLSRSLLEIE